MTAGTGSVRIIVPSASVLMLMMMTASRSRPQAPTGQTAWLQYATAEDGGFSTERLERARRYADSVRAGAVMVIHQGNVIAAWGDITRKLELHSVRKSLVSGLYGSAVAEGRIDLDRTLADVGIDDRSPLTDGEKSARIRDVIAARSGIYLPAAYAGAEQDAERPERGSAGPDTRFFYNNWDFNIAGVIWERLTGEDLYEGFGRRIAAPTGMQDYATADGFLVYEPSNSDHPAHTFRMSTRDLARFGQLYLQQGEWNGRQVLPAAWIRESTASRSDLGGGNGYALMWWTYSPGALGASYPELSRHASFAGQGTGGQLLLVVPDADLVIVHRGDTDNGRDVRGRDVWRIAELILESRTGPSKPSARLVGVQPAPLSSQAPARPRPEYLRPAADALQAFAGDYEIASGVMARVFMHAGRLFINMPGQGEAELLALEETEFTIMPVAGVRVRFERDESGRVTGFDASLGPQRFRGVRR